MINYTDLALRAKSSYLEGGQELNDSIEKIAREENLSSEQIKRVCEKANEATFLDLFEKTADKNFKFPLADSGEVIGRVYKEDAPREKVAYEAYGTSRAADMEKAASESTLGLMGISADDISDEIDDSFTKQAFKEESVVRAKEKELICREMIKEAEYGMAELLVSINQDYRQAINEGMHDDAIKIACQAVFGDSFDKELDKIASDIPDEVRVLSGAYFEKVASYDDIVVNDRHEFIQKIAAYLKLKETRKELLANVEKVAHDEIVKKKVN
jgi:hypothetical protein